MHRDPVEVRIRGKIARQRAACVEIQEQNRRQIVPIVSGDDHVLHGPGRVREDAGVLLAQVPDPHDRDGQTILHAALECSSACAR